MMKKHSKTSPPSAQVARAPIQEFVFSSSFLSLNGPPDTAYYWGWSWALFTHPLAAAVVGWRRLTEAAAAVIKIHGDDFSKRPLLFILCPCVLKGKLSTASDRLSSTMS